MLRFWRARHAPTDGVRERVGIEPELIAQPGDRDRDLVVELAEQPPLSERALRLPAHTVPGRHGVCVAAIERVKDVGSRHRATPDTGCRRLYAKAGDSERELNSRHRYAWLAGHLLAWTC
jgi:hypothetical protein